MPTEPDSSSARIRRQIQLSMTVGLVLFVVLLVAFALLLILQNADDASAVSALRAIIYVAATCFALDAVFLLTLVAHTLLALLDQDDKSVSSEFNDLE